MRVAGCGIGLNAAQDAVRIGGSAPIIIAQVISVGQKPADFDELPVRIHSGKMDSAPLVP
jgi:hypothetical protein